MKRIEILYPNLSKKAVAFTIDDGDLAYDRKFIDIVSPYGIKGTFNLCPHLHREFSPEYYREFYRGYDIANHTKYHPGVLPLPLSEYQIGTDFDRFTSDRDKLYPLDDDANVYFKHARDFAWGKATTAEHYVTLVDAGRYELEEIFGRDNIVDFVWPGHRQSSELVCDYVTKHCRSARTTGLVLDKTNYNLPADLSNWSYNACHTNLLEQMEKFAAYPDDGELKFFSFGVHSQDYERDNKWDELSEFAKTYGNRPDEFWYAGIKEIFDYAEAVWALEITEDSIKNNSNLTIYLKVDGAVEKIDPHGILSL